MSTTLLIKTDGEKNSNKYWRAELNPNGNTVVCSWGRIGGTGESDTFSGGQNYIDKKVREKLRKGYKHAQVILENTTSVAPISNLAAVVHKEIRFASADTKNLLDELIAWNVHQIAANSTLTVDLARGTISLPSKMGVLTAQAIIDARGLLKTIGDTKPSSSKKYSGLINSYLMLVPQVTPRVKGWTDSIFATPESIAAQESLLDSLEGTLKAIAVPSAVSTSSLSVFDVSLDIVSDSSIISRVEGLFTCSKNGAHQSSSMKLRRVFAVRIGYAAEQFEKCPLGNVMELWHGTSTGNLLSILKSGLIIPTTASNGRAYGNGVYFSDQSTKALNYAAGYSSSRCFMFLADVKMGKEYVPTGYGSRGYYGSSLPAPGFDSTWAKAGTSGVANNEMIVYNTAAVNLKFLCEFV